MHRLAPVRAYRCLLVYYTPAGRRRHYRTMTVAPDKAEALKLAERHLAQDTRRRITYIELSEAIEQ